MFKTLYILHHARCFEQGMRDPQLWGSATWLSQCIGSARSGSWGFVFFSSSHTEKSTEELLYNALADWEFFGKLHAITADSAEYVCSWKKEMNVRHREKKHDKTNIRAYYVHCIVRGINIVVKACFKEEEVDEQAQPIRCSVASMHGSQCEEEGNLW